MPYANHRSRATTGLLEVCPLAHVQTQTVATPTQPYYVVVLLATDQPPLGNPGRNCLYLEGPGQLPQVLAQVPARAQGQVLRFADDLLYAAGSTGALLLSLFHELPAAEPLWLAHGLAGAGRWADC